MNIRKRRAVASHRTQGRNVKGLWNQIWQTWCLLTNKFTTYGTWNGLGH